MKRKVLTGLSGGVDSTVAALLLKEQGYEVIGVTMAVYSGPEKEVSGPGSCYGPDEKEELKKAKHLADLLGIPHYIVNIADLYEKTVISHFRETYLQGRTPNPCVICNAHIKFRALTEACTRSGIEFDYFATGHYARILRKNNRFYLREAADSSKDQTYFLYRIDPSFLEKIIFPLGELSKAEVRETARKHGLPVHDTPDSKGFYSGDYRDLLGFEDDPGNFVDKDGNILGQHRGIWNFTIGQKRGLGLPGATEGKPTPFVIAIRAETKEVVIGTKEDLLSRVFRIRDLNWLFAEDEVYGYAAENPQWNIEIKVSNTMNRSRGRIVRLDKDNALLEFSDPQIAIAPGQSAVLYADGLVMGGGFISEIL